MNELRNEAAEVEAELGALNIGGELKFRTLSGTLGLTIAIYGVAAGLLPVAAGLGSLLSLLGLIHAAERNDKKQYDLLTSRLGYVLIKAKDIVTHRHSITAARGRRRLTRVGGSSSCFAVFCPGRGAKLSARSGAS